KQPTESRRYHEEYEEYEQRPKNNPAHPIVRLLIVEPQRRTLLPFRSVGCQDGNDVVDAARNAFAEIAGLEARRHRVGYDHLRQRVGQGAFQAVADFDAYSALVRCNEQQYAVVFLLFPEPPLPEQFIGVRLDLLAFQ